MANLTGTERPSGRGGRAQRTAGRETRSASEQAGNLGSVVLALDEEFTEKERLSEGRAWCTTIPQARKERTVREFCEAFHNARNLSIRTCAICYCKVSENELELVEWGEWVASSLWREDRVPCCCRRCFPIGERIPTCSDCVKGLRRGALSHAIDIHRCLGCDHMFPEALRSLSPVEEKLIVLNSCYGFITKFTIPKRGRCFVAYQKHVKGHITVFPNNVQALVGHVLPHPLVRAMKEVHVAWQGVEKPRPSDVATLLSVRRAVVEKTLVWLKGNNPLCAHIDIDTTEMDS